MMGYGYGNMAGGGILGIIPVILIGVIVYAVFKVINQKEIGTLSIFDTSNGKALDILRARYAKGEITEEEYIRMKETINK